MDDGTDKVVVIEGLQDDLNVALQQPRLCEVTCLVRKRLTIALVQLALRVQFIHWTLLKVGHTG